MPETCQHYHSITYGRDLFAFHRDRCPGNPLNNNTHGIIKDFGFWIACNSKLMIYQNKK
jgi:hypothetical protein